MGSGGKRSPGVRPKLAACPRRPGGGGGGGATRGVVTFVSEGERGEWR